MAESNLYTIENVEAADLAHIFTIQSNIFGKDALKKEWLYDLFSHHFDFLKIALKSNKKEILGVIATALGPEAPYLYVMYVIPQYQRKGLGSLLLREAIERIKKKGFGSLILHTKDYNTQAISFYEKFSFKVVQQIPKYYRSGDNAYEMELKFQ